jgi:mycofactocin precursor
MAHYDAKPAVTTTAPERSRLHSLPSEEDIDEPLVEEVSIDGMGSVD